MQKDRFLTTSYKGYKMTNDQVDLDLILKNMPDFVPDDEFWKWCEDMSGKFVLKAWRVCIRQPDGGYNCTVRPATTEQQARSEAFFCSSTNHKEHVIIHDLGQSWANYYNYQQELKDFRARSV